MAESFCLGRVELLGFGPRLAIHFSVALYSDFTFNLARGTVIKTLLFMTVPRVRTGGE